MALISWLMWLLGIAVPVFFAVHAYRHGKPIWIFIVLFFPVVGSLVYLFAEFLPSLRAGGRLQAAAKGVARRMNPGAEIQRLEDAVALSDSVANRRELARAYREAGRMDDAVAVLRGSLTGIFENDPQVLGELCRALYEAGRLDEAREVFEQLRRSTAPTPEHLLLSARIYEDAGDVENALREYAGLTGRGTGEEARCRYALLLQRVGRHDEAAALFDGIVRHARLSSPLYRKTEKPWIDIAERELKGYAAAAG